DAGVEVERALLLTQLDQRHARHVDGDVEDKIAAVELPIKHRPVVLPGQCGFDKANAVRGGDFTAARLGGDDGDLAGTDLEMAQQQWQDALADAAEADDDEAS